MEDVKQNTIVAATAVVVFFLLKKKQAEAAAAEGIQAGAFIDEEGMARSAQQTHGCGLLMDQRNSIYIRVPGYNVYYPQTVTGPGKITQEDDNIILTHY